jgi:hypothetical protein
MAGLGTSILDRPRPLSRDRRAATLNCEEPEIGSPSRCPLSHLPSARTVRTTLPAAPGRTASAARIATRGFGWTIRQEIQLLLRHWWPAALLAAMISRQMSPCLGQCPPDRRGLPRGEKPARRPMGRPAHCVSRSATRRPRLRCRPVVGAAREGSLVALTPRWIHKCGHDK